jgi:hypothetical protein
MAKKPKTIDVQEHYDALRGPLHRELSADVYPVEMVYATIEVKRLLEKRDLPKVLKDIQKIRALGEERWYVAYTSVPKGAANSGQSVTGQIEFKVTNPKPRSYLVAFNHKGWSDMKAFARDVIYALEETPTHIHGIVVLDADWFATLKPFSTPRTGLKTVTGNSLLRFVHHVRHSVASMPMHPVSIDRYLAAATPNKPLQRTRQKAARR